MTGLPASAQGLPRSSAYGLAPSSFREGPVFPSLFLGAAGGMAVASLPGLKR